MSLSGGCLGFCQGEMAGFPLFQEEQDMGGGGEMDCISQAMYGKRVAKMSSDVRSGIPSKQRSCFF